LAAWTTGGRERHPGKPGDGSDSPSLTTPYLSPEQVLGEQEDERSDIFSLGVVLFEMLTGRTPFIGQTRSALELQIMQTSAPMPSSINASSPPELDPIVTKALAKSIDQRYISAATLAAELRSVAAILDVRSGANDQPETAVGAPATKRSVIVWIGLAFAVGALGAAVWLMRIR
jgi:serine/threonine protein kinase